MSPPNAPPNKKHKADELSKTLYTLLQELGKEYMKEMSQKEKKTFDLGILGKTAVEKGYAAFGEGMIADYSQAETLVLSVFNNKKTRVLFMDSMMPDVVDEDVMNYFDPKRFSLVRLAFAENNSAVWDAEYQDLSEKWSEQAHWIEALEKELGEVKVAKLKAGMTAMTNNRARAKAAASAPANLKTEN